MDHDAIIVAVSNIEGAKCYLAGPMRGIPHWNRLAFETAAALLRRAGWNVIFPHDLDAARGVEAPADGLPLRAYPIGDDLKAVAESDAVFVLAGWQGSEGARLEVDVAHRLGVSVYTLDGKQVSPPVPPDFDAAEYIRTTPSWEERQATLPKGSAGRKALPLTTGVLDYFPAALAAVAAVSKAGNDKHNPGEPLHHARGKSTDHADSILRHLIERGGIDADLGLRHSAEMAWRALALLQQELEDAGEAPLARAARLPEED